MAERGMTVRELREHLAELPDHYEVLVEVIVGGDLHTDDVDLVEVTAAGSFTPYVRLVPDGADNYGTEDLINEGLAARAAAEEAETKPATV